VLSQPYFSSLGVYVDHFGNDMLYLIFCASFFFLTLRVLEIIKNQDIVCCQEKSAEAKYIRWLQMVT
jgi:hypothetical protein